MLATNAIYGGYDDKLKVEKVKERERLKGMIFIIMNQKLLCLNVFIIMMMMMLFMENIMIIRYKAAVAANVMYDEYYGCYLQHMLPFLFMKDIMVAYAAAGFFKGYYYFCFVLFLFCFVLFLFLFLCLEKEIIREEVKNKKR